MRRVLVLAYYFPPIGGAGAQRPARLVAHLRDRGWEPVVVTGPGLGGDRWTPTDDGLARELPDDVEVLRVPGPEPEPGRGWEARAEFWLGRTSAWQRWWVEGAVAAGRRAGAVDLVYTWLSPFATTEAAERLARELGVPWVADLGDPWALDEMMVYATRLHRRLDVRRMGRALSSAAAVVMSTEEAVRRVRARLPALAQTPVVCIPNGYDARDFAGEPPAREDGAFRIVHTGYLHTALGLAQRRRPRLRRLLGETVSGVDFLTRSHVYLLQAVDRLRAEEPELAAGLEVHLAGVLTDADLAHADGPAVRLHGYLAHADTLALLRSADVLFLPMQDLPPGVRATIVPGKTYEYLGAGRPILGAVPDGDARDILRESGGAWLCRPADVEGMVSILRDALARHRAGEPPPRPAPELVRRFEYGRLADELAAVFDESCGARPEARIESAGARRAPDRDRDAVQA